MFVLDSTQSMNTADTGCTVTGVRNPTRYQCALYSVQSVLKVMQPSMASVGLMAFPGTGSQFTPSKPCPTQPSAVPYLSSNIHYQIGTGLSTDYNNGSGTLSHTSTIVEAVGDYGSSPALTGCQTAKGGEGTYLAEVLTKAQAALPVVAGTKNVIILLSDGDAQASSSQLSNQSSKVSKQCGQYVTAAQAATTAGTTVYAVAYGAPTSGCSSGDTYNPCTALKAAASNSTKFYSTNNSCAAYAQLEQRLQPADDLHPDRDQPEHHEAEVAVGERTPGASGFGWLQELGAADGDRDRGRRITVGAHPALGDRQTNCGMDRIDVVGAQLVLDLVDMRPGGRRPAPGDFVDGVQHVRQELCG